MSLAWDHPCLVCGLEVAMADADPDFRRSIHNACVPEYHEMQAEFARDAARDVPPSNEDLYRAAR